MSDIDHLAAIREYATELREGGYTAGILSQTAVALRVDHIIRRTDALAVHLAEAERQRDWHRDDAAMVRRERDAEVKRLVAKLAGAEAELKTCRILQRSLNEALRDSMDEIDELRADNRNGG